MSLATQLFLVDKLELGVASFGDVQDSCDGKSVNVKKLSRHFAVVVVVVCLFLLPRFHVAHEVRLRLAK